MRSYIKTLGAAAVLATLTGCLDLNEEIVTGVTTSYYEDAKGMEDAVNATYATLRRYYGTEQGMGLSETGTDLWGLGAGGPQMYATYGPELNSTHGWLSTIWGDLYRGINTANAVIARSEQVDMPTERREQRIAEVRWLRAKFYFLLVQTFGDVHLSLEETRGVQTETHRTPKAEIYEAIIADLEVAASRLPATQTDFGRLTRGAAQHLLAKVYLTRAESGDMARAAALAREVIDSGQYALLPRFIDVFDIDNKDHSEIIFSVRFSQDRLSNPPAPMLHMYWTSNYAIYPGLVRSVEYGRPFARARPSDFLFSLWNRDIDSRYDDAFRNVWLANDESNIPRDEDGNLLFQVGDTALWLPGEEVSQELIDSKPYAVVPPSQYTTRTFAQILKHQDQDRPNPDEAISSRDVIVARFAETYLIAAEALLRDGKPEEAVEYVNVVRRRAAKPGHEAEMNVAASDLDMDFILDERARELASEHHRWFDLVRTGTLLERVIAHNPDARDNIQPHHVLRPIPQSAIDQTTSEFPQNPGY